jgi:hypothetical protein
VCLRDACRPPADGRQCRLPGRLRTNMKSLEVYAAIRDGLGPSLKSLGFRREKAFISWSREHERQQTVLWCQVSRDGWDDYAGSKFVVEFQRSNSPEPGAPSSARARLAKFLTEDQRAEARRIQSQVIASLSRRHGRIRRSKYRPTRRFGIWRSSSRCEAPTTQVTTYGCDMRTQSMWTHGLTSCGE